MRAPVASRGQPQLPRDGPEGATHQPLLSTPTTPSSAPRPSPCRYIAQRWYVQKQVRGVPAGPGLLTPAVGQARRLGAATATGLTALTLASFPSPLPALGAGAAGLPAR